MKCERCLKPLTYEADEGGRYTRLFSIGQNGSMFCPSGPSHVPPRGMKRTYLKLLSRFENWEV